MLNRIAKLSAIVAIVAIAAVVVIAFGSYVQLTGKAVSATQCNDRIDNDGDGKCDYGTSGRSCTDGSTRGDTGCSSKSDNTEASCVAGSTTCGVGACQRTSTCVNDAVSCTPGIPINETCNSVDDNCNGAIDDGLGTTTCGVGACQRTLQNCVNGQTQTCIPGTPTNETCGDSIDNDCDGLTDEGCITNSCSDTDGGFKPAVQGTVSGLLNGTSYSFTDTCTSNNTLREYYCSGNSALNTLQICSGSNITISCTNGACI